MVQVTVIPEVFLADEAVKINVSGLEPNQLVTLRASLTDERGLTFDSKAFYHADASGKVDLEQTEATGGYFRGVLPMGLFWTLRSLKPLQRLVKRDVMGSPFRITIAVYDSLQMAPVPDVQPLASQTVEMWYVTPGVQRIPIKEGRVRGALFLPPGDGPFPGVIEISGGFGGLLEYRSALLASRGFTCLALAYFGYDDLPPTLTELDLVYFEEAVELLLKHPKVLGPGIGILATSKGAEIALAMATFLKQVKATVCINGLSSLNLNPLRYRDLHMPCIPYCPEGVVLSYSGAMDSCHAFGDPRSPEYQDSVLPVERALGQFLFVVGGDDKTIHSKMYAEEANRRLRRHGRKNSRLLLYPGAGHIIEPPGSPYCPVSHFRHSKISRLWGGELVAHAKAQEQSWQEIQRFLKLHLGCPLASRL